MSSTQERIDALREEKDALDCRIEELERTMRWEAKQKERCASALHKQQQESILQLRSTVRLVTSNTKLVKLLDTSVAWGGGTPHSQGHFWRFSDESGLGMCNMGNGISLPPMYSPAWPQGSTPVSGVFSYSDEPVMGNAVSYPTGTMIDFCLLYPQGPPQGRKGLILRDTVLLQLLPEKKVFASLAEWIGEMGRPSFGAVRVCLQDPRTRHEKVQEALNNLGSFREKVAHLRQEYKLKQFVSFSQTPTQMYESAVRGHEYAKKEVKRLMERIDVERPEAASKLTSLARWLKSSLERKAKLFNAMDRLPEEERHKAPVNIYNRTKTFLYTNNGVHGRCLVADSCEEGPSGGVYHRLVDASNGICASPLTKCRAHKWEPQGPAEVCLLWRGEEIVFNL